MTASDLQEWLKVLPLPAGNGARRMGGFPPASYATRRSRTPVRPILLASNFIVPMQVPAGPKNRRLTT